MRFAHRFGPIRLTLLALLLTLAQLVVAAHYDFDDGHPATHACTVCAALSALGAANVSTIPIWSAQVQPAAPGVVPYVRAADPDSGVYRARGPPAAS